MEAVGIGCLWFARRSEVDPDAFDPTKHLAEIRRALEGIDSISNLEIKGEANIYAGSWSLADDALEENFFPIYARLEISFDIFLPVRVQEKYTRGRPGDDVESLKVRIIYKGHLPVMYVHYPVTGAATNVRRFSPSTAIVVVRKYLDDKLKDNPEVQVQVLGPSPFHADLFIGPAPAAETTEFLDLTRPGDGYGTFYLTTAAQSASDRITFFIEAYHHTLSSFYFVIRLRNRSRLLASEVIDGTEELLDQPSTGGLISSFNYWRGFKARIDAAFQTLLLEKMNRLSQARTLDEVMADHRLLAESPLTSYIKKEIADASIIPDEDVREILIMLEERRRGYFAHAATLLSGLLGGILGAVVGAGLTLLVANTTDNKSAQQKPSVSGSQPNVPNASSQSETKR